MTSCREGLWFIRGEEGGPVNVILPAPFKAFLPPLLRGVLWCLGMFPVFFYSQISFFLFPWGSSSGIVAAVQGLGPRPSRNKKKEKKRKKEKHNKNGNTEKDCLKRLSWLCKCVSTKPQGGNENQTGSGSLWYAAGVVPSCAHLGTFLTCKFLSAATRPFLPFSILPKHFE